MCSQDDATLTLSDGTSVTCPPAELICSRNTTISIFMPNTPNQSVSVNIANTNLCHINGLFLQGVNFQKWSHDS